MCPRNGECEPRGDFRGNTEVGDNTYPTYPPHILFNGVFILKLGKVGSSALCIGYEIWRAEHADV